MFSYAENPFGGEFLAIALNEIRLVTLERTGKLRPVIVRDDERSGQGVAQRQAQPNNGADAVRKSILPSLGLMRCGHRS